MKHVNGMRQRLVGADPAIFANRLGVKPVQYELFCKGPR